MFDYGRNVTYTTVFQQRGKFYGKKRINYGLDPNAVK